MTAPGDEPRELGPPVIEVRGVGKRFKRPPHGGPASLRSLGEMRGRVEHWALRDLDLTVYEGEALGIIGVNGAGKSTLLRLLSGLTDPTTGTIVRHVDVSGLLTLGDTFAGLLTATENALTAAILGGLTRREAEQRLPVMAEFAELTEVMDQPLRTFSDGMRLRLAFAVAIHTDPRVLLIDEVLAVGDLRFRQKCLDRLLQLHRTERVTVVLTSHELEQVETMCTRAVLLAGGRIAAEGHPAEVTEQYRRSLQASTGEVVMGEDGVTRFGDGRAKIRTVRMSSERGGGAEVEQGGPLVIEIDVTAEDRLDQVVFSVTAYDDVHGHVAFDVATVLDDLRIGPLHGDHTVRLVLQRVDLAPGPYIVDVGLYSADFAEALDFHGGAYRFEVPGRNAKGPYDPPRKWELA